MSNTKSTRNDIPIKNFEEQLFDCPTPGSRTFEQLLTDYSAGNPLSDLERRFLGICGVSFKKIWDDDYINQALSLPKRIKTINVSKSSSLSES